MKAGKRRPLRRLVFRLLALLLGLVPFFIVEAVFVTLDWGRPSYHGDPFVGFSDLVPLFELSDDGTRYEIPPSRLTFFRPESFSAEKGADEFRIFCLGGSTVQGRPFSIETSFTTWLELNLQAADPSRQWEVVNCGGVSYASYRLAPILDEVLGYDPDLIVLYTGHNEFLEDRTYDHIKERSALVTRSLELLSCTRTFTLLRAGYLGLRGDAPAENRPVLGPETAAILEYEDGLEEYHRDEKWRRDVIEHFQYNLRRMVRTTHDAGVGMLLVNPVSNLRDCPPFKNQHRDGLTAARKQQWKALLREAQKVRGKNIHQTMELLKQAVQIDDQHAGLHFGLAQCYEDMGRLGEAKQEYLEAKELDICPLRILEPMNRAVVETARQTKTPMVDVREMFEQRSEGGIPGNYYLVDHVHPSIAGHRLIADALTEEMIRQGMVRAEPNWKEGMDQVAQAYLYSLGDLYFSQGEERLERLRGWTKGMGSRVRQGELDGGTR